jgi:hypothetical protein
MMIKDKQDTQGGRSKSGAGLRRWSEYSDRWDLCLA